MKISRVFQDKVIESEDEFTYHTTTKIDTKMKSLSEYTFAKVDQKFIEHLEQGVYHNQEFLTKPLLLSWGAYTDFLNKSIAYVAIYQNKIVSVIIGTARYHNIIAIDIKTEEQHRMKGLAYELTQRFVNECVDNNLVAHWNCVDSNIASKKTAEKAGFLYIKKKPYFWFNI